MIIYDKVSKIYTKGEKSVLKDISLEIREGEFVTFVGYSGAGKSTLLKMIYAEELPTAGSVYFHRKKINNLKRKHLPKHRQQIGTVFQDYKLLAQRNVWQNVAFAMEASGKSLGEIEEDVPQIIDIIGLKQKINKYPNELSGGEQQRVALARALVNRPKVLVADEPTGNLDPISTWEIMQLLLKINEYGTTVMLATHDKGVVDRISKRVVSMDKGKIIRDDAKGKYCI
jgi:cell division transport system ATP-binding protein